MRADFESGKRKTALWIVCASIGLALGEIRPEI